jgi:hypothetical protein
LALNNPEGIDPVRPMQPSKKLDRFVAGDNESNKSDGIAPVRPAHPENTLRQLVAKGAYKKSTDKLPTILAQFWNKLAMFVERYVFSLNVDGSDEIAELKNKPCVLLARRRWIP